jgi:hypothetical protein
VFGNWVLCGAKLGWIKFPRLVKFLKLVFFDKRAKICWMLRALLSLLQFAIVSSYTLVRALP